MPVLDFYYKNKKVKEDMLNWRDIEIEVNFEDNFGEGAIKSGAIEFTGDLAGKINDWIEQGNNGGPGIFEGPPFRIETCGNNSIIFNGCIDTAECTTEYECDKVVAPLRSDRIDFINDRAGSFRFSFLASPSHPAANPGHITQADYVQVPYVINSIPDYVNVMIAGVSVFILLKEAQEIIEKTVALVNELTGDTAMVTGSLVNPVIATAMAIGRVLVDIIRILLYILYLAFIIKALIDLLSMIFENLIQPVKFKKGMKVVDLFNKGADYLNMPFSSTLLTSAAHKNDIVVPRKSALFTNTTVVQNLFGLKTIGRKNYDDAKNPLSVGYPDLTFADLILQEEERLNAELRIINNVLHFETQQFWALQSNYILPNIKRKNADPHTTNACELASNYSLSYALDDQDTNTFDEFEGTSCQMQLVPNTVQVTSNILLKNLTDINLRYALAKRKVSLNAIEEVVSEIYNIIAGIYNSITGFFNSIIKVINKIMAAISTLTGGNPPTVPSIAPFPPNPIQARIGMMILSSDFIGIQKIMRIDPTTGKLHSNNKVLTAASTLMDNHHFTNFAVRKITTNGTVKADHNQWLIYTDKEIPFCCDDFQSLVNNNYGKTHDGKLMKVKSIVWKPERSTADITYRVKEQYTRNLNQSYIIDGK